MALRYCGTGGGASELALKPTRNFRDGCTHVRLDVEVLEVEGVLPDVDADDGDEGEEGVLVGGRRDLETLGRRVQALQSTRRFAQ